MNTKKSDRVLAYLREGIQSGRYRPGDRLPSENALSQKFQVTRVTVGKALAELAREGRVIRRQGAGSFVSVTDADTPRTFGLLVPGLGAGEIFEPICNSIAAALAEHNHRLLWGQFVSEDMNARCAQAERLCQGYIEQQVDGVFFAPIELTEAMHEANERIAGLLAARNIPVVLLDQDVVTFPRRSAFDLVGIDNRRAGYVLARHLIERGCKRIAFVTRPHSAQTVDARIAGYSEALLDHQKTVDFSRVHFGDLDDPAFIDHLLTKKHRPDGVVCANDYTAAKLTGILQRRGVRIPEDVRIVGVDDLRYAAFLSVPLTTIRQPCAQLGYTATHAMLERMTHPAMPGRDLLVDFELILRHSSS